MCLAWPTGDRFLAYGGRKRTKVRRQVAVIKRHGCSGKKPLFPQLVGKKMWFPGGYMWIL